MQTADYVLWAFSESSPSSAEEVLAYLKSWDELLGVLDSQQPMMLVRIMGARLTRRFNAGTVAVAISDLLGAGYLQLATPSLVPQDEERWEPTQAGRERAKRL